MTPGLQRELDAALAALQESLRDEKRKRTAAERQLVQSQRRLRVAERAAAESLQRAAESDVRLAQLSGDVRELRKSSLSEARRLEAELEETLRTVRAVCDEKMRKEVGAEKGKQTCIVCMERPKSVLVLPCRHLCMCAECARQLLDQARRRSERERRTASGVGVPPKCPICRGDVKETMDVFA